MLRDIDLTRAWTDEGTLNFTRYIFKSKYGRKFVVGRHHRVIAHALDRILAGDPEYQYTMINLPPRYSKTELVIKSFVAEGFARNPQSRFLHLSYSNDLTLDNSRDILEVLSADFYRRLYPDVYVTGKSAKMWRTTAGGGFYAASSGGQVTGFGAGQVDNADDVEAAEMDDYIATAEDYQFAGAVLVDDPLKPEDALSDLKRERVNARFENTIRSRTNSRHTPIVIIMQRLHERDLCGYLLEQEGRIEDGGKWKVISLPALSVDEEGNEHALWPFKHTVEELHAKRDNDPYVFDTQYQQDPTPIEGLMYAAGFQVYDTLPEPPAGVRPVRKNYTDTADTGSDFLCSIDYLEFPDQTCYVIDVLYTDKPMEFTQPETARMLNRDGITQANIESNNGGHAFAIAVRDILRRMGNRTTAINWFAQTANKAVRIFMHSAEVQNMVFMPRGWEHRWPAFYKAVTGHRKEGGNAHDDAPDALTGIIEKLRSTAHITASRT